MVSYSNSDICKPLIIKDNNNKSGVYRWINNVNHKTYIGSSVNLTARFYVYFNLAKLTNKKSNIYSALFKHGYSNFSLEILEYCEKTDVLSREQYFIYLLKPEYNMLKLAGSSFGYKHTQETLDKFKSRKVSEETRKNLSIAATGRIITDEEKLKISEARKGLKLSMETRAKLSAATTLIKGVSVVVKNVNTYEEILYPTLTAAAVALGVSRTAVKKAADSGNTLKKMYIIQINKINK